MEKETAVDYIFRKLDVLCRLTPQTRVTGTSEEWQNLYEQAKAMEKEQIIEAYGEGYVNAQNYEEIGREQFYDDTYGGNNL